MTFVLAGNFLDELIVFADSTISYGGKPETVYGLNKVNILHDPRTGIVLFISFSGKVYSGMKALEYIFDRISNYGKPFEIPHLSIKIKRWIEEALSQVPVHVARPLSFLVAGCEPRRRLLLVENGKSLLNNPLPFPFYTTYIYRFILNKDGKVSLTKVQDRLGMIGSGSNKNLQLELDFYNHENSGLGLPIDSSREIRARVLSESLMFKFNRAGILSVGGPFVLFRHQARQELLSRYVWSSNWMGFDDVEVEVIDNNKFIVTNANSQEKRVMLNITDWFKYKPEDDNLNSNALA